MYSAGNTRALPHVGFPIRRSRDQGLVSTSPALIAAAHVLHRLLAPRHPPCALVLLIEKNTLCAAMEFSRCTPPKRGLSKLSSVTKHRGRHCSRRARYRTDKAHRARLKSRTEMKSINGRAASGVIAPESLERR